MDSPAERAWTLLQQESPGTTRSLQESLGTRPSLQESPGNTPSLQESPGNTPPLQESPGNGSCRISDSLAQTKGGVFSSHVVPHPLNSHGHAHLRVVCTR